MTRRVLLLNPWGVGYMDDPAEQVVAPGLQSDTDLEVTNLGDSAHPYPWPDAASGPALASAAAKAEADGVDAIVVGCCGDPFVAQMRTAVDIPVIGITEAICHEARDSGKRLGVMARVLSEDYTPLIPAQADWEGRKRRLEELGLPAGGYSVRALNVPTHPDLPTLQRLTTADPAALRDLTMAAMTDSFVGDGLRQAAEAVKQDDAELLYFACAFWSTPIAELDQDLGATVFNPLLFGAQKAEQAALAR